MEERYPLRLSGYLTGIRDLTIGDQWKLTPFRSLLAGAATASAIVFCIFLFWILNTGKYEPILYFQRIKTSMMYSLWIGVLATYLVFIAYVDGIYFSGKATRDWQIIARILVTVLAIIYVSQGFWSVWVTIVTGTPSLSQLAVTGFWGYLFLINPFGTWSSIYALLLFVLAWFIPYLLVQEFSTGEWSLPIFISSPIVLAMLIKYYQLGPPVLPLLVTVAVSSLPILTNLHWRIKQEDTVSMESSGGLTQGLIQHQPIMRYVSSLSIGLVALSGLIITLYPISSNQTLLLDLMNFSPILVVLSIAVAVRFLRARS